VDVDADLQTQTVTVGRVPGTHGNRKLDSTANLDEVIKRDSPVSVKKSTLVA
jgi:hypothetical protein